MEKLSDDIKSDLLERMNKEQTLRKIWGNLNDKEIEKQVIAVDTENTEFLKSLVNEFGWPKISDVGEEVALAAWLIAQHSPDLEFMNHCLELMREDPDEVDPRNIATTVDRVRVMRNHQLQYYGTQFTRSDDGTRWVPHSIEDVEHVNERRKAIGLNTIEEITAWYNNPDNL
jgi:hypothetical protein